MACIAPESYFQQRVPARQTILSNSYAGGTSKVETFFFLHYQSPSRSDRILIVGVRDMYCHPGREVVLSDCGLLGSFPFSHSGLTDGRKTWQLHGWVEANHLIPESFFLGRDY